MRNVAGKVALITGGAMGMGKLLGAHFVRDGAKLVIWDMNQGELDKTVEEHKKIGGTVAGYLVDVTNKEKVFEAAKKVESEVGPVDILVNNAGIVAGGDFLDVPMEKHMKVINVNINGVMICTHAFLGGMIQRDCGHIVNMASAAGLLGVPSLSSYCASKFAVVGFTESLRMEFMKNHIKGVKTTTICPSFVSTGMFEGVQPPKLAKMLSPQRMAEIIYDAMKNDKILVKEPFMVKTIPLLKAITHPDILASINQMLGVTKSMETYTGREKSIPGKTK